MKYIKKFNNEQSLVNYTKNNFVTPHLFLNTSDKHINHIIKYRQLEYISSTSTGGQYIDLGCKLLENTDDVIIDIKFNITGNGKGNQGQSTLIANQPETSPYPGFVLRKDGWNNVEFSTKWSFDNSTQGTTSDTTNKWYSKYLTYNINGNTIDRKYNNIYELSLLVNNIPQSEVHNMICYLFCALNSSNQPFRYIKADLYYLKFTKGGQVIRNLIPVKKVSTGEIGLFDMENDHLYLSQGDDPFVAGPIKTDQ